MVFDTNAAGGAKKPRLHIQGKLIGIQSDSAKCKLFDRDAGKFSFVRLSLVTGKDKQTGEDVWFNATAFDIDMAAMLEFNKADKLLLDKKHPIVEFDYYTTLRGAVNDDGSPKNEEVEELRDGKTMIVRRQVMYLNNRLSKDDVIRSFKVLLDDDPSSAQAVAGLGSAKPVSTPATPRGVAPGVVIVDDGLDDVEEVLG